MIISLSQMKDLNLISPEVEIFEARIPFRIEGLMDLEGGPYPEMEIIIGKCILNQFFIFLGLATLATVVAFSYSFLNQQRRRRNSSLHKF